jgi:hypothetical protein
MEAKAFAVGLRMEHPRQMIDKIQYGMEEHPLLPAANYKVTAQTSDGRGVYSFCMCPGGYVVNASSEEGRLAVNGMSYSGRDGQNANSAIIVSVTPKDFLHANNLHAENLHAASPLAGIYFQQELEEKAYALCRGKIPQQLFGDYCDNRASVSYGGFSSQTRGETCLCNLRGLLPADVEQSFMDGMKHFGHIVPDFDRKDAILSGIESRTSSPVRITRDENFQASVAGIYPCGEGAGYAGGIMSAAMDGLKVAEAICKNR